MNWWSKLAASKYMPSTPSGLEAQPNASRNVMSSQGGTRALPPGLQSKSTPNLPAFSPSTSPEPADDQEARSTTSPLSPTGVALLAEAASVEDNATEDDGPPLDLDSSGSSESDPDETPPTARPPYTSRWHSHGPTSSSMLFPPFYNRPPTPLPPSPSLTSLLRPSFSATPSRPTTPDSSDVDIGDGAAERGSTATSTTTNLASITKSARNAPTVPRASPKVPTYEYYGFALYLASSAAFLLYLVWAYVPSPLLHQMGIHYYPNRWWALAVPCWLVVLVMYIYVALASYNTGYLTLPLSSCENLVDECAQIAVVDRVGRELVRNRGGATGRQRAADGAVTDRAGGRRTSLASAHAFEASEDVDWKQLWSVGTDAVMDVPIGGVCEILYG